MESWWFLNVPCYPWRPETGASRRDCPLITSHNTLADLLLSGSKFLNVFKTMHTFAKRFEVYYGFLFNEAKMENGGVDMKTSMCLSEASLATFKWHDPLTIIMLQYPVFQEYDQYESLDVYKVSHLINSILAASIKFHKVLLLHAVKKISYKLLQTKKRTFLNTHFTKPVFSMSMRFECSSWGFTITTSHYLLDPRFNGLLDYKVAQSKPSKSKTRILKAFPNKV